MRRFMPHAVVALGLVLAASASAATSAVQIKSTGFAPATVSINQDDSVKWTNTDTKNHQVVANDGSFASPVLKSGETFSFTFTQAGKTTYHDAFATSKKGTVTTNAPAANVTLTGSTSTVTYGDNTTVSGTVTNQLANEPVTLMSQPYGKGSQSLATTMTQANGAFSFGVSPTIQTSYQARWRSTGSPSVTINVRPRVGFGRSGKLFVAKVTSDLAYAGHYVWVQRKAPLGSFRNVKRVYLGANSRAVFRATLPKGRSILRLVLPQTQAGVGYTAGTSRLISFKR